MLTVEYMHVKYSFLLELDYYFKQVYSMSVVFNNLTARHTTNIK